MLCKNNEPFLNRIATCDDKWTLCNNKQWLAQWLDWEKAPKHFPKPDLHQRKVMITVWWSAAHLICYTFWIPAKPWHLRSMLSKSMRCTKNYNACSWHWSTERAQFFMTTPNLTSHNCRFKSWTNWVTKFCLIHHIHLSFRQGTTTFSSISTTFCRENASTTSRKQEIHPKSSPNLEA